MSVTLSLTESQTLTALRAFILAVLPAGVEVVRGQDNRVPEPVAPDFLTMTPILRERLATNISTFQDGFPSAGTRADMQETKVTVQLDIHGPASADNTQIISTLIRSDVGVGLFKTSGFDVTPLYSSEPRQMPYVNGEQQVETRWVVDAVLQCNPVATTAQDFFATADVDLISVDRYFPPN